MKFFICLVVLIGSAHKSFSCDCSSTSKYEEYEAAKYIFLGHVLEVNELSFVILVTEALKNKSTDTLVSRVDDCSIFPEKGEYWLFYAIESDDNSVYISSCGASRSFNRPLIGASIPEPPPKEVSGAQLKLIEEQLEMRALSELHFEIATLRSYKIRHQFEQLEVRLLKSNRSVTSFMILEVVAFLIVTLGILFYFSKKGK